MKKTRFSETQFIGILQDADAGIPVKESCRQHAISAVTGRLRTGTELTEAVDRRA